MGARRVIKKPKARSRSISTRGARRRPVPTRTSRRIEEHADDSEDEATDDEDSDDEEREKWEERLLAMESTRMSELDAKAKQAPHLATKAKAVPYQLVIPTYQRWMPVCQMSNKKRFKKCKAPFILMHSLSLLSRQRIPKQRVTLFVANEQERKNYRKALHGSEWADVRIEVSVVGNKASRNFIMKFFPAGTYVVSLDDDVERISWKIREGMTPHVLRSVPPGGLEKIIFDAYKQMKERKAFLWGVNTSQFPRHMKSWGMSTRNGLVNGYLNGFITRPQCKELYRAFADATEDSEFSVRHYAKDGIVLRYRMYAGITSPYLNRGGLQKKFEAKGERITAEERSKARKTEERWGAMELHQLFPRLIGPPKVRRDRKTMEVNFYSHGCPPGEVSNRKRIAPRLMGSDRIRYKQENPKLPGCHAYKLYEGYKRARTVAEASRLGARPIDLAHDYNWGFLSVLNLTTAVPCDLEIKEASRSSGSKASQVAKAEEAFIKVRIREMSLGHRGLDIPKESLMQLAAKVPELKRVAVEDFAKEDGPLASIPLVVLRTLLRWAATGSLRYERCRTKAVNAALKALGLRELAKQVKKREAEEAKEASKLSSSSSSSKLSGRGKTSARRQLGKVARGEMRRRSMVKRQALKSKTQGKVRSAQRVRKTLMKRARK
eukprot:TRINITY_DN67621_c0_g1_i1.p1 TRINITY_DN67621_c0_g1~~TRINITY_DN67621_c0_g1_i1.p1  ORF type:complete len:677 (-),score=151.55 TRINITY_DN67621_c0_g1_i1:49-2037(-)